MSRVDATLGLNTAPFRAGLGQAKASLDGFSGSVNKGMAMAGGALGGAAITAGIKGILDEFGRLQDMSDRFNVSAETLQRLGFAAKQSGTDIEAIAASMGRANRAGQEAANGNDKLAAVFDRLGVNAERFASMNQEQQFLALADAMHGAADPNRTLADLQQVMGRNVGELIPLLQQGSEQIAEMGANARVASDDMVALLDAQGDLVTQILDNTKAGIASTTAAVIGAFMGFGKTLGDLGLAVFHGLTFQGQKAAEDLKKVFSGESFLWMFQDAADNAVNSGRERNAALFEQEEELTGKVKEETKKRGKTFEEGMAENVKEYEAAMAKNAAAAEAQRKKNLKRWEAEHERETRELGRKEIRKQLDALNEEMRARENQMGGISASLARVTASDSLQSAGLGLAGVNYGANPTVSRLDRLRVDLAKKLDEVKHAIEEQELALEEDQF